MKRAVLYARVSTDAQQKEGTIESQVLELKRQIAAAGDVLVKEYIDDGYSGTLLDRPALEELRRDVKTDLFDAVYFLDTDRIARDVASTAPSTSPAGTLVTAQVCIRPRSPRGSRSSGRPDRAGECGSATSPGRSGRRSSPLGVQAFGPGLRRHVGVRARPSQRAFVPGPLVDDRGVFAGVGDALVHRLAEVDAVGEYIDDGLPPGMPPAYRLPGLCPTLEP